ncbi:unnamed protein product [Acanthoscelides obtectus]|uniref:Uncharacterized protein n=1 Tax=Acanthoscelides obtectus TaxID=200917 RepID=A0A9P0PLB6_ACAOB|nr:unnamed protein product [Acanthoscelides obtectus]CAK1646881.1 hypothetical protein AOBTE_LOCUS14913 [Acanthoscelides obtectus]
MYENPFSSAAGLVLRPLRCTAVRIEGVPHSQVSLSTARGLCHPRRRQCTVSERERKRDRRQWSQARRRAATACVPSKKTKSNCFISDGVVDQ